MDHCTLWFEGWWAHCCAVHDVQYSGAVPRAISDLELLHCVATSGPEWLLPVSVLVAVCMYIAVRIFGSAFYNK